MNPAHNFKNNIKNRHIKKLQPIEPAIAYFVALRSEIQLANF